MANRRLVILAGAVALILAVGGAGYWWYGQDDSDSDTTDEVLPVPPVPPRIAEGEDYDKCLAMLGPDPNGALDFAETWQTAGGGEGAVHCLALAEIELGNAEQGADMLDKLAHDSAAAPAPRATIYGQADQAWMMAGKPDRAIASATAALVLTQDDADLFIDRATASLSLERYKEATDDLSHALDIDPKRDDALVLRATALRNLNRFATAQEDIDTALALNPENPDALLERGILRQRQGDEEGARRDWERALELAPDTATGDLAQQNLALLEAGPERR